MSLGEQPPPYESPEATGSVPTEKKRTSGWAVASLIFGVSSFCLLFFTGLPAIIMGIIGLSQANNSQGRVGGQGLAVGGMITGGIGTLFSPIIFILIALLLPAVNTVRESARRSLSSSNMKQQTMAVWDYQVDSEMLPPAAGPGVEGGKPVSWRLQIAPYIEADLVYNRYNFEQEWDDADNLLLSADIPSVLKNPNLEGPAGITNYLVLSGPETAFPPGEEVGELPATSQTILFVEADEDRAVPWTQPKDIDYDPTDPLKGLGSFRPGIILVSFADGSTRMITNEIDPVVFHAMATRDDADNSEINEFLFDDY